MEYYRNLLTLIIVSGIVVLTLGVALVMQNDMSYMPFVVTFSVGLLLIIVVCISEILLLERATAQRRDLATKTPIAFDACPDNFTKRFVNRQEICSNELVVRDPVTGRNVVMKTYPVDDASVQGGQRPFPRTHSLAFTGNEPKHEKFRLNEIVQTTALGTNEARCSVLNSAPTASNLTHLAGYDLLPWTTMRSRCSAFSASTA